MKLPANMGRSSDRRESKDTNEIELSGTWWQLCL